MALMRILILSNGIAAHDRSSLGVLSALQRHRAVDVQVLSIRPTRRLHNHLERLIAGVLPFGFVWHNFYQIKGRSIVLRALPAAEAIPQPPVDLIISTGRNTSAANIALARQRDAKNIYFGGPRWPSDRFYTLLLSPRYRNRRRHIGYTPRPSELDCTTLPAARRLAPDVGERRAALLFGGQSRHFHYTNADMELLAARLAEIARELPWLKWTLSDSRRTPKDAFDLLLKRLRDAHVRVEVVRFAKAGPLSNAFAFRSDLVLSTADSMSMMSESVAAARPTGVLMADRYKTPPGDAKEIAAMLADRRVFSLTFSELTSARLLAGASEVETLRDSQLDVLYRTIASFGI